MANEINRIDIAEFRRLGLLQEVNRQFFHPRGLALEVVTDLLNGAERLGGVWDYRGDPQGMAFEDEALSSTQAAQVQEMFDKYLSARQELFETEDGIQPIPEGEPPNE